MTVPFGLSWLMRAWLTGIAVHGNSQGIGIGVGGQVGAVDPLALVGDGGGQVPDRSLFRQPVRDMVMLVVDPDRAGIGGEHSLLQRRLESRFREGWRGVRDEGGSPRA